jgi:hypothetical protein
MAMKKKRMLTDKEFDITTNIQHWRFEDGETIPNLDSKWKSEAPPRGWYCWVYTNDHSEFIEWMGRNCPSADCTSRFNSGNPMVQTYIKDDKDATLFQLRWL